MRLWPDSARVDHGRLSIGGIDVEALCRAYGTPLYILDEQTFRAGCRTYREALNNHYPGVSGVYYSGKSLLNMTVAKWAHEEGLGIDVVSAGEVEVARRSGVPPERLHLHGNAKPSAEIKFSVEAGVGAIVVDSLDELASIESVGQDLGRPIRVLLRIAPGVGANTHAHIRTGQHDSKFGLLLEHVPLAIELLKGATWTKLVGVHCHLGSQIFDLSVYPQAIEVLLDVRAAFFDALGYLPEEISPGGGLGSAYVDDDPAISIDQFVRTVADAVVAGCARRSMPLPRLFVEPGRSISARSMVAVYSVIARKDLANRSMEDGVSGFIHLDGGMADNLRPALYGARYQAAIATRMDDPREQRVHIAGRYCESSDILIRDIAMPQTAPGDLVALPGSGAYTLSMASNYNWTCRPALVAVNDGTATVVQRRETVDDLLRREVQAAPEPLPLDARRHATTEH